MISTSFLFGQHEKICDDISKPIFFGPHSSEGDFMLRQQYKNVFVDKQKFISEMQCENIAIVSTEQSPESVFAKGDEKNNDKSIHPNNHICEPKNSIDLLIGPQNTQSVFLPITYGDSTSKHSCQGIKDPTRVIYDIVTHDFGMDNYEPTELVDSFEICSFRDDSVDTNCSTNSTSCQFCDESVEKH